MCGAVVGTWTWSWSSVGTCPQRYPHGEGTGSCIAGKQMRVLSAHVSWGKEAGARISTTSASEAVVASFPVETSTFSVYTESLPGGELQGTGSFIQVHYVASVTTRAPSSHGTQGESGFWMSRTPTNGRRIMARSLPRSKASQP
jgi:hypothetical protein